MSVLLVILISLGILKCVHNTDLPKSEEEDLPVFEATDEWQDIKRGQSIPPGLHVRVDLQTGKREAKLMGRDEEDSSNDGTIQLSKHAIIDDDDAQTDATTEYGHSDRRGIINKATKVFTRKELSEMLRNIKDESPDDNIPLLSGTKESSSFDGAQSPSSSQRNNFMTMDELKQMVTFHSDVETMLEHLHILTDPATPTDDIIQSLHELEYHVHQIDNARDLDLLGGLVVIVKFLNHSNNSVKSAAAFTLGAAVQGNPEVQEKALAYQTLPLLLNLLTSSSSEILQRRALYALGSLIRGHPSATEAFVTGGGLDKISYNVNQQSETVMIKIITLLTDLLTFEDLEYKTSVTKSTISSVLSSNGWCSHVTLSLQSSELKTLENTVLLMDKLQDECDFTSDLARLERVRNIMDDISEAKEPLNIMIQRLRTKNREL